MLLGCRDEGGKLTARDTEGRSFAISCEPDQGCKVQQTAGPHRPGEPTASVLRSTGLLVAVCRAPSATAQPASASDCRALVCSDNADCPPAHGLEQGSCISGLCAEPAGAINPDDAVMLCLAGTGLGRESPLQVERYAMAMNCGSPCRVPKPCRQP